MTDFIHFVLPGLPERKEKELAREVIAEFKHLPGKHEQASHGKRGGTNTEERSSLILSKDERAELENNDLFLHGTEHNFNEFKTGTAGLIYFSEPTPTWTSQAEHIANAKWGGGVLVVAKINTESAKRFDPVNDKVAREIYESKLGPTAHGDLVHYSDLHDITDLAIKKGYNYFRVLEENGTSIAVSDPSLITIQKKYVKTKETS